MLSSFFLCYFYPPHPNFSLNNEFSLKMTLHETYMQRCFDLAQSGEGHTAPNPMVGAVLAHDGRIIGEGFHARYGGPHAEVNAVASVPPSLRHLIPESTLYVSLEPCCITGKTGACTSLILKERIKKVVVSCLDMTPGVAGQGIALLRAAGVEVVLGILEQEGRFLSRVRNHFVTRRTPYITVKYAVTPAGYFAPQPAARAWITHPYTQRFTHRLRSAVSAILIGTQTALLDDPGLDNRLFYGPSPLRVVLDRRLQLPAHLKIFDGSSPTLVIHESQTNTAANDRTEYLPVPFDDNFLNNLLAALYERKISSLLVEGGAQLIQSFFDAGLWQEAIVYTGNREFPNGLPAPRVPGVCVQTEHIGPDIVRRFVPHIC